MLSVATPSEPRDNILVRAFPRDAGIATAMWLRSRPANAGPGRYDEGVRRSARPLPAETHAPTSPRLLPILARRIDRYRHSSVVPPLRLARGGDLRLPEMALPASIRLHPTGPP